MKKIVAVLLALALCMSVALAETVAVTGTWYLNQVSVDGTSMAPAALGMEMTMTLNEDNTASMDAMGEVVEGTWAMEGESVVITFEGDPLAFTLVEGNLTAELSGATMTFGKERTEVEIFTAGEAKADAVMADYNGTWNATLVDMLGMQLPMADMGTSMQLIVEDGKVTMISGEDSVEGVCTVENGVLVIEEDISIQLHEGDVLTMTLDMSEDLSMTYYFEKVVE
ncbi:MAG: hypothetical protein E7316_08950 [Clostridiales bacterium]|nr:hypothetical protein [Clostridiales bacterium]